MFFDILSMFPEIMFLIFCLLKWLKQGVQTPIFLDNFKISSSNGEESGGIPEQCDSISFLYCVLVHAIAHLPCPATYTNLLRGVYITVIYIQVI